MVCWAHDQKSISLGVYARWAVSACLRARVSRLDAIHIISACAFSASHWQVVVDLLRIGQFHVVSLAAATESELAARVKLATLPVAPCDPCEAGAFGVGLLKLSKGLWSSSSRGRELALREAHAGFRSSLDSDAFGLPYEREESKRRGCLGGRQVKFSSLLDENGTPRSTRNRSPPEI
jgi:hypothetical protein